MAIPTRDEAQRVLASFALPAGIVTHVEGVARVAAEAARLVAAAGIPVDARLVESAALLHDIDKLETRGQLTHGLVAAQRLTEMGHDELAPPVASHPVTCLTDDSRFPRGWPSVIVSVADRHVTQEFVTVDQRIDDLKRRHPEYATSLELARRHAHALEAELAAVVGMEPDALVERLREAWRAGG